MFEKELKELGLTDNEVRIYLILIEKGSLTPSEISQKLGLHRGYIYDALERMQEKQIISYISKDNKKYFIASDPKNISELLKDRLERFENIIPGLLKLQNNTNEGINVQVFKGKYAFKVLLNDLINVLKPKEEVLLYGIDEETLQNLAEFMPMYIERYFAKIIQKKITERVITKQGGKTLPEAKTTTYRFLPKEIIGNTAFQVYGNKVAIFLWGEPNYLILIENKEVANSYKNQFNILWNSAKS